MGFPSYDRVSFHVTVIIHLGCILANLTFPHPSGKLIQQIPSQQLNQQRVNGLRVLTGVRSLSYLPIHSPLITDIT